MRNLLVMALSKNSGCFKIHRVELYFTTFLLSGVCSFLSHLSATKKSKSTALVQKWPQVCFSTVEIHPAGEKYSIFPARHFFGNLTLLDLALSLHVPAQTTRWFTEQRC